jgi:hypothetical protein
VHQQLQSLDHVVTMRRALRKQEQQKATQRQFGLVPMRTKLVAELYLTSQAPLITARGAPLGLGTRTRSRRLDPPRHVVNAVPDPSLRLPENG